MGSDPIDGAPGPPPYLRLVALSEQPAYTSLEPSEAVERAWGELKTLLTEDSSGNSSGNSSGSWSPAKQARILLAVLPMLDDYAAHQTGYMRAEMEAGVEMLRTSLSEAREAAGAWEAKMEQAGAVIDRAAPGGGTRRTGRRGRPTSFVTEHVEHLLPKCLPEWDAESQIPDKQELRDRLSEALESEYRSLNLPFDLKDVDPRPGGPISKAITTLNRRRTQD